MLPLYDDNPTWRRPLVTIALIAANVAVFALQISSGPQFNELLFRYGAIPGEIVNSIDVRPYNPLPVHTTMLSSMFMHGGFLHLAGNMLFLWIFGNNVEDVLGRAKFIFFYLACGLAAVIAYIALNPDSPAPLVGASGAIAGVLAAYVLAFPRARVYTLFWFIVFIRIIPLPAWLVIGVWFLIQVSNLGSGGQVAWVAHVGGFLAGLLLWPLFRIKWER
jgi:membrane associated rhomboid family serine protease